MSSNRQAEEILIRSTIMGLSEDQIMGQEPVDFSQIRLLAEEEVADLYIQKFERLLEINPNDPDREYLIESIDHYKSLKTKGLSVS